MTQKVGTEHRIPPVRTGAGAEQSKMRKPEGKEKGRIWKTYQW